MRVCDVNRSQEWRKEERKQEQQITYKNSKVKENSRLEQHWSKQRETDRQKKSFGIAGRQHALQSAIQGHHVIDSERRLHPSVVSQRNRSGLPSSWENTSAKLKKFKWHVNGFFIMLVLQATKTEVQCLCIGARDSWKLCKGNVRFLVKGKLLLAVPIMPLSWEHCSTPKRHGAITAFQKEQCNYLMQFAA